jgi:hypothetical protein
MISHPDKRALALDPAQFRRLAHAAVDLVADYLGEVGAAPVFPADDSAKADDPDARAARSRRRRSGSHAPSAFARPSPPRDGRQPSALLRLGELAVAPVASSPTFLPPR